MALVIFDYDGVLADTLDDLIRFGQEACNQLGVYHVVTKNDLSNLEVMSFSTYGRACEVPENLLDEFVKISLNLFAEKESPPAIFDGLSEVIKHLSSKHKIAIVTTNSSKNVRAFLTNHGLESLIHAVYGVDTPGSKAQKISMREAFWKNERCL
ncbi:MAG: HAD hydrolase-like protein [Anaerolineales bacterium]|nr:HAD hydrolase-like protein [Anaerolineales bacterium]